MLYNAKILRVVQEGGEKRYTIHYQGWNKRFDETVPRASLVVNNEEGIKLMERLRSERSVAQNAQAKKVKNRNAKPVIKLCCVTSTLSTTCAQQLIEAARLIRRR
jgi:hypothetical protein